MRRSTKRWVRRSCRASDRLSSMARGALLPMLGVGEPVGAVGDEGPGADVGDAVGQRVDVAIGAVGEGHLLGEPVLRDALLAGHQELVERGDQLGVVLRARSCGSRGSGTLPTAGRRRRARWRARRSRDRAPTPRARAVSSAMRARVRRPSRGDWRRLSRSRSSEPKSRSRLRHCSERRCRRCASRAAR